MSSRPGLRSWSSPHAAFLSGLLMLGLASGTLNQGPGSIARADGVIPPPAADARAARVGTRFRDAVEPILADHCYACHGSGIKKGNVILDEFADDEALLARRDLWNDVLKNVRAGLMPPPGKPRLSADEAKALEDWIKRDAFDLDPADPDPGRVTLRRLNRVEYRNTIRDLMGIDFRADEEFPADDSGYGFDTVADVLSISPLLLEKYLQAAETIVGSAVPVVAKVVQTRAWTGREIRGEERRKSAESLSLYEPARLTLKLASPKPVGGAHKLTIETSVAGQFDFDPARAKLRITCGDRELIAEEIGWGEGKRVAREFDLDLPRDGESVPLAIALEPLVPADQKRGGVNFRVHAITLEGPLAPSAWDRPKNFERFFDRDDPTDPRERRAYARAVLSRFVERAYRRPVDPRTVEKLVAIAEDAYSQPGRTVQFGVARGMVAVLASPRFLFRVEDAAPAGVSPRGFPLVDEYALASRLSYFLWGTMPDAELIDLARRGELRRDQAGQVRRMLADPRSEELVRNFVGQWLQARDYEHFPIQHKSINRRDRKPQQMDGEVYELRRMMRQEAEAYFAHVLRADRPIVELIDSNYAFVNEALARHYDIPGVEGREIRQVTLPPDSPRGGLLTQGGVLMITSNPSRTSPVKRGQFILENILGTPTPPPPPDIPSLEDALKGIQGREPSMREVMEVHRANALCASCHNRMDPLGLAFENFNALGSFRAKERDQAIDASGKLVTGRTFRDARELKQILTTEYRLDFARCLVEKMMTYALGRGPEYHDVATIDAIVARVDREGGKFSAVLDGIIESAAFQRRRPGPPAGKPAGPQPTVAAARANFHPNTDPAGSPHPRPTTQPGPNP